MGDIILDGNPPVGVTLRRSSRAKRLSLRVSRLDGRVTLSMPTRLPEREALAFLREKEDWIRKHLGTRAPEQSAAFGARVPFLGREVEIVPGQGRRARLNDGRLEVPGEAARVAAPVKAFLKLEAQMRLREASDRYAALLGTDYGRITLRDPRSRWGSCTSAGNLMYSWRLVMAPVEVLDYVAAHEVAHRLEMNHSDRFWAHVARVCPDHAAHRRWLHTEGEKLHAWRFETD
ncbi:M48 family metallopeptidase [Celeribacter sp. PS-C1]|uniref:M48 family metallopeptidase n=1 Tax=Celeribacter sp. PS-C1 TaxID=2820813 RepID=UPI001C664D76|nr:SprT family zinc-dependent metalloprotease [Celeribacter sp. PS-C1]MBW6419002.1 M48 family metallopeptidase [Celeribacter sp. PS-C1]